jgi:GTP cyclohydrolase II
MSSAPPKASIRRQVMLPLRFVDGYTTAARVLTFDGLVDGLEHLALGLGRYAESPQRSDGPLPVPLVRPHSECLTGDVFGSQRCDCGAQLREAVERIAEAGGYLLYLRQEGRGIGLYRKLDAYLLQDGGLDTYEANLALGHAEDERDYTVAAQMLEALRAPTVALFSNNPDKAAQLTRLGVTVTAQVPTGVHLSATNAAYLETKAWRGAHTLYLTHRNRANPGQGAERSDGQPVRGDRQRWDDAAEDEATDVPAGPTELRRVLGT